MMLVAATAWGGLVRLAGWLSQPAHAHSQHHEGPAQAYTGIYHVEAEYRALKASLDQELQRQADQRRSLESAQSLEADTLQEQEQQAQVRWHTQSAHCGRWGACAGPGCVYEQGCGSDPRIACMGC